MTYILQCVSLMLDSSFSLPCFIITYMTHKDTHLCWKFFSFHYSAIAYMACKIHTLVECVFFFSLLEYLYISLNKISGTPYFFFVDYFSLSLLFDFIFLSQIDDWLLNLFWKLKFYWIKTYCKQYKSISCIHKQSKAKRPSIEKNMISYAIPWKELHIQNRHEISNRMRWFLLLESQSDDLYVAHNILRI